jgi:hypothetical protein
MPPRSASNKVDRKVFFSRITKSNGQPVPSFDWLTEVLPITSDTGRCSRTDPNGHSVRLAVYSKTYPLRFALTKNRQRGLPRIGHEKTGKTRPLDLKEGEGLDETTHFIVFEDGWIGHEFNFYGPRFEMLASFLKLTSFGTKLWEFRNAVKKDLFQTLGSHQKIIALKLRAPASAFRAGELASNTEHLDGALRVIAEDTEADTIEIIIKRKHRGSRTPHPLALGKNMLHALAQKLSGEPTAALDTTFWDTETGHRDQINLLSERITTVRKVQLESQRSRAVDDSAAFEAIEDARESLDLALADASLL